MAFSLNRSSRAPMADINVTPLVDVMLVLLIIFMVTAPMLQEGVSVELPSAKGEPIEKAQQRDEVIISVSGAGSIYVNDKAVTEDQLATVVLDTTKDKPNRDVFLRADKTVPYGVVVRIMASLKTAGIANLGMITTPQEESSKSAK
ncbi:MAG: protein TolR [Deltaproteobacteria bacterium]|nr:protein TolR [Deltaproteobacteria bacterium]